MHVQHALTSTNEPELNVAILYRQIQQHLVVADRPPFSMP